MRLHFLNPLRHQTLRRNHKDPLDQSTELQFPEDQPRLDGLAQTNLIGQQVANPIFAHCTRESVELVRERDDASFQWSQQNVLRQCVGDSGRTNGICDSVDACPL